MTTAKQLRALAFAGAALAAASCSSDPPKAEPGCVAGLSTSCAATYDPPAYDTIFTKILLPNCGVGTGTCHTSDGAKGGLVFAKADESYGMLLGTDGDRARVVAGDPSCSLIMKRLTSSDPDYHMPPGSESLSAGDQCTIVKWIAAGAAR